MKPSAAAMSLTSLAGLQHLAGNPATAAVCLALAVCLGAWALGGFLGRMICHHAEAMYRDEE